MSNANNMSRFGCNSSNVIDVQISENVPKNTIKSKQFIWKQFAQFCAERNYEFTADTSVVKLAFILKDWGFNMRKIDGTNYKEGVVKTIWNSSAKMLQEKYFNEFGKSFDPFKDIEFLSARRARDTKRKELQHLPDKQKVSSAAFTQKEHQEICKQWDEETPLGLQRKFYHVAAVELAWRGGEAASCLLSHFKEEVDNRGNSTGRIEYNPIFSKTCQGGSQRCAISKWLISNAHNPEMCPVRLFKKLISKRGINIKSDRLFLTVNGQWKSAESCWYKNSPVGINTINKWTKTSAEKIGLDTKSKKITNHSNRATAVSQLIQSGAGEQEAIKITGHGSSNSIKPYLQLNNEHHANIISKIRQDVSTSSCSNCQCSNSNITYNNCTVYNYK